MVGDMTMFTAQEAINRLCDKREIFYDEMVDLMRQVMEGKVVHAKALMHGKVSQIQHSGAGVFRGLPTPFQATRYHSLAIERASCPAELAVTAWTDDGEIMGVHHVSLPIEGVQFHPESILTEHGHRLLANFLQR